MKVAPRHTPTDIVQRLNRELTLIMGTTEMASAMAKLSFRPMTSSPQDFAALIRQEHEKWGVVIHEANLRLE